MELKVYRRPDLQWKCGLSASGDACPLGPDQRGRCESQQCHPQRTLRWWRSYLPVAFAAATLGISACLLLTQRHREVIAPGPLSMAHAQLIHDPSDPHRCASCHEDSANRFTQSTMDGQIADSHTQTQRCLVCHVRELPHLNRATPHDLVVSHLEAMSSPSPPAPLPEDGERGANARKELLSQERVRSAVAGGEMPAGENVTSRLQDEMGPANSEKGDHSKTVQGWFASLVKNRPIDWHQHQLACSDCHREHQGAEHDLQSIASQRCQACHQKQFNSFADGHPEFSAYPAQTSVRLTFDHAKHSDLHFPKSARQFDCRICHLNKAVQGRVGQIFRAVAFETACASCHLEPMKASLADGIIVFQLPSLDLRGLAQRGAEIGNWPEEAGQILDGRVPPFMRWLLASQEDALEFFKKLPTSGKLSDFNMDNSDHRKAILTLAAASRQLLGQLAHGGQKEIQRRLRSVNGPNDQALIDELMRGVPPDLFRQAYRDWFEKAPSDNAVPNGLRVSTNADSRNLRDESDSKDGRNKTDTKKENGESEWLSASPDSEKLGSHLTAAGSDNLLDDALLTDDPLVSVQSPLSAKPESLGNENGASTWKPVKARQHLEAGGWMIDSQRMAIVYIPAGHADPWLTAMLTYGSLLGASEEQLSSADATNNVSVPDEPARSLLNQEVVGHCTECHSAIDSNKSMHRIQSQFDPLWRADRFDARVRQLTRFDHGPHLIQPTLTDCAACHRMVNHDRHETSQDHRDFQSMRLQDCASCHRPQAAGDNCTQCHNYHTNVVER